MTVYFVDPSKICPSTTRRRSNYKCRHGRGVGCFKARNQTADALYLQNGPTSDQTLYIPPSQDDIDLDVAQVMNNCSKDEFLITLYVLHRLAGTS